jgi:hypothetical protein
MLDTDCRAGIACDAIGWTGTDADNDCTAGENVTETVADVLCNFKATPALGALATLDVLVCLTCWDADGWTRTAFEAAG